jgi:hypothetical protein
MNIDIDREVQSAMPAVLERMRENLITRMSNEAERVAMDEVRKAVNEWALATLVPEIKAQLEAGKESMLKQAGTIAQQLGDALGAALTAQAEKTLAQSHAVSDIAQKLFRGY